MAQQTINVGSSANSGGGDPLRNALIKVNENFTEVYAKLTALEDGSITTDITGDLKGNVYAADSTLLVDAVNGTIPYSVLSDAPTIPTALSDLAGDYTGSVFADDSTLLVDGVNANIPASVINGTLERNNIPIEYLRFPDPETLVVAPTPSSTGTKGDVVFAGGYLYVCVATNTWVRYAVEAAWG